MCGQQGALLSQQTGNHVKWIWAAESRPGLRELGRVSRASGLLTQFGIATEEDTVPTSKRTKLVSKLLSERRVDQPRKPKKGQKVTLLVDRGHSGNSIQASWMVNIVCADWNECADLLGNWMQWVLCNPTPGIAPENTLTTDDSALKLRM